jgi:ketosteroid isomerase-like protein
VPHKAELWDRLTQMFETADVSGLPELYTADAVYLEPYSPPHRGNLLIEAYLKDYFGGKEEIAITSRQVIEDAEGNGLAVEWSISYTAAGRRWNDLPRATFFTFGEDGRVTYQRDYS